MSSGDRLRRGSWAEAARARYRPRLRRLRAAVRPGDPGVPCPGLLPKPRLHSLQKPCASSLRTRLRSEEHTSELQSPCNLVCRLLLEKKKKYRCILILI